MTNVKTIFFDLDDTLVDHAHARREAMRDTYERFRAVFHQIPLEVLDTTFDKVNDALWGQLSRGEITAAEMRTQRFLQTLQIVYSRTPLIKYDHRDAFEIDPYFVQRYEFHTREFPHASETLRLLHGRYTLGIITNGLQDIQSRRLSSMKWDELFTHVVTPDLSGAMKPDTRMFEAAEAACKSLPDEIAFVGDSHHYDISGARRHGWKTVWFNPRGETSEGIADIEIRSLSELAEHFFAIPA